MEELIGFKIKVFLNSSYGVICSSGKFIKIENGFLLIETDNGPEYISLAFIKLIKVVKENG
jgi:hypothetical protein